MSKHLSHSFEIDGSQIHIFDGILSEEETRNLHSALLKADVTILGCSNDETTATREVMFELELEDFRNHKLNRAILDCISTHENKTEYLCYKTLGNYVRFGSNTFVHQDAENSEVFSALYFANSNWHYDWGGELVFFDSSKDVKYCVSPRPGRLVVFPAKIFHRAGVPTRPCTETRITLSARYCPKKMANKAVEATG